MEEASRFHVSQNLWHLVIAQRTNYKVLGMIPGCHMNPGMNCKTVIGQNLENPILNTSKVMRRKDSHN